MKIFKYITLIALMIFNHPLLAMKALQKKQAAIAAKQEKKAVATVEKIRTRKKEAEPSKEQPISGPGIKVFESTLENPIQLNPLAERTIKGQTVGWYPTADTLTKFLNTYEPLKKYLPGMPEVSVEESTAEGNRNIALFVAYRNTNTTSEDSSVKGKKPLFFLKISLSKDIPEKLDVLQKGPVGRFGLKALSDQKYPIIVLQEMFVRYKGNDHKNYTIEIMHLAHGESVVSILDSHQDLKLIQRCAESVGRALGLFHVEFMNYHNSSSLEQWTTMIHGDFHMNNVFFDENTSRVYFIDNGDMKESGLLPFVDLTSIPRRALVAFASYREQRICELNAIKYEKKKDYAQQIDKQNCANNAKRIGDNSADFVVYFLKGYLSAYPLDKRKKVGDYLQQQLNLQFNPKLEEALKWGSPDAEDIRNFIKKFDEIFTEASAQ